MVLFAAPLARSPCHRTIPLAGPDVEMLPPPAANTNTGTVLTRQYEYPHTISRYRRDTPVVPLRVTLQFCRVVKCPPWRTIPQGPHCEFQLCENDLGVHLCLRD